jgi:uncharacterized protein with PQ loop repeat
MSAVGIKINDQTECKYAGDKSRKKDETSFVLSGYALLVCGVVIARRLLAEVGFSSILTLGAAFQCLGFYTLLIKVERAKSVAGISSKTIHLYAAVLFCRLGSTCIYPGYLPVDSSGDFLYQLLDIVSLFLVLQLIKCMDHTYPGTYQEAEDTMDVSKMAICAVVFAIFIHGNLNDSFLFDTMWTASMNLDTVAMLPQLWMVVKLGEVEALTSHFVALLIASRACSFAFWFYGYKELRDEERHGRKSINLAGLQLLAAHALQLLLSLDFLFYYVKARIKGVRMQLPSHSRSATISL